MLSETPESHFLSIVAPITQAVETGMLLPTDAYPIVQQALLDYSAQLIGVSSTGLLTQGDLNTSIGHLV
jgi:hypothetical protein